MKSVGLSQLAAGGMAALSVLMVGACSKQASVVVEKPLNIVALDRSGSTEAFRSQQKRFIGEAISDALDRNSPVGIWVVDRSATCVFDPRSLESSKDIKNDIFAALDTPKDKTATRTRPALFWQAMEEKYGSVKSGDNVQPINIVYLTDGGNDWADEDKKVVKSVTALSANSRVRIAVVGVNPDLKPALSKQFAVLEGRAVIWGREATPEQVAMWRKGEGR